MTEFTASGHALSSSAVTAFAAALSQNKHLQHICIGNATFGDDGLALLGPGLAASSLKILDLELKGISLAGAETVARICTQHGRLVELRLARNALCDASAMALAAPLSLMPTLNVLDLRENALGADACRALRGVLSSPSCHLQKLLLSRNSLTAEGVAFLVQGLRYYQLGYDIDEDAVSTIQGTGGVGEFNATESLSSCSDGSSPAESRKHSLVELQLESCGIGDYGVEHLAAALRYLPSLHTLVLDDCDISPLGAVHLAKHLCEARALVTLRLHGNERLGSEGACALAAACKEQGSTVRVMDVGKCSITTTGILAFIGESSPLTTLSAFGNRLREDLEILNSPSAAVQVEGSLIEDLDLGGNGFEEG